MYQFPIGVILESFKVSRSEAIKKAAQIGANGIQMVAAYGENAPENLTKEKRKNLLDEVKSNGLCFSAICGDLGQGFWKKERNPELIDKSKRIMELAKDLETDIVTTHIGPIPEDENHDRYKIMQEACFSLAEYADSLQSHFAVETGPEKSKVLKKFLDSLHSKGVAVNLDPANLVMVVRDNPIEAVYNLKDYIVHTHAKDGKNLWYMDPEAVYGVKKQEKVDIELNGGPFEELPLGQGDVLFKEYLKALDAIGYQGFLTIEREVGEQPEKDIITAYSFLQEIMK